MKYSVVIFDLDGTLLDTLEDLADSVNYTLEHNSLPQRTLWEVRSFVGNGITKLIERAAGEGVAPAEVDRLGVEFRAYYKEHCADKTRPYAGIPELLETLRSSGVKTALVSNKGDFAVQELVKQYFPGLFDYAVGDRDGIARKPAPDSVNEVLSVLGFSKGDAIYVGDSDVDVETALNAGTDMSIVTWGFRDEEFLISKGARNIARSPDELKAILL